MVRRVDTSTGKKKKILMKKMDTFQVTICVISADRYLAVTRPLRYKSIITKTKVVIMIIFIWVFSIGILLATVRWSQVDDVHEVSFNGIICQRNISFRFAILLAGQWTSSTACRRCHFQPLLFQQRSSSIPSLMHLFSSQKQNQPQHENI